MSDRPTPRQRRKQARPGEILAAALSIFHTKGFAASKIEDVAQAAGVTKGTVYLYFPSKEALFKAAVREIVIPNIDRIEDASRAGTSATGRLRISSRMWASGMNAGRGSLLKLMIAEAENFPELAEFFQEEVSGRMRKLLMNIVESGIASGEFRACNPATVTRALSAPILLSDIWRRTFPEQNKTLPEPDLLIESLLDVVLNGIVQRTEGIQ